MKSPNPCTFLYALYTAKPLHRYVVEWTAAATTIRDLQLYGYKAECFTLFSLIQLTAGLILQDICHCINQSFSRNKHKTLETLENVYKILDLNPSITDNLDPVREKYNTIIDVLGDDCL